MLVIGSTGFIGSHCRESLLGAGFSVHGTSTTGAGADLACDVTSPDSVDRTISSASPDAVLLTAGQASVADAWKDPVAAFRINLSGPAHVLDAMQRHCPSAQLIFASSAGVYGTPGASNSPPFSESDPVAPESPYGASKAAAEVLCHQYQRQAGMRVAVARIFNQIGPGQSDAQAPAEFSREIVKAERRGDGTLRLPVGNRLIQRDFTDVRDTARALTCMIEDGVTGNFNVCSGVATSLEEIVAGLEAISPVKVEIDETGGPRRPGDILAVYGSHEKLSAETGWHPRIPLQSSLTDLLQDWRDRS